MNKRSIEIPAILKIGSGMLNTIGQNLKANGIHRIVIYFGNGLIDMFGKQVMDSLQEADVSVAAYCELDTSKIEDIIELAFSIDSKVQAVVGKIGRAHV